jgi:Ca2+-binding RTX toxin-like protein
VLVNPPSAEALGGSGGDKIALADGATVHGAHGDDGNDQISYGCTTPVSVDLNAFSATGVSSFDGFEQVVGGFGNDVLTAPSNAPSRLAGTSGNDTITGGSASGDLLANDGNDTLDPGPGSDAVVGDDGDDTINVRDDASDRVFCSDGLDSMVADRVDVVASDCESVDLPPTPPSPPATTSPPPPAAVTATDAAGNKTTQKLTIKLTA